MDILVDAITKKKWSDIPNNSMVITFDDGHVGNYELLEIIKKYKINPTIYCCSDIIGTQSHFWWKEVDSFEVESFKYLTNEDRLASLESKYEFRNDKSYSSKQALGHSESLELAKFSTIGSHTRFHPILTCCNSREMQNEISLSKNKIQQLIGKECQHFCYPNGDYNDNVISAVKNAGYKSARTIDVGWNDIDTDPFKLKITGITDNASLTQVIAQLTGITMFLRYLFLGGSFRGKHKTILAEKK
jgi:peptidoglycan/xylan/chitin deacetylase (PgdA/CDA1 family)